MSRNVRGKPAPTKTPPPAKRRSSNSSSSLSDLSDDDGYSAVEEISDSEDEEAVNAAEEEHMITAARKRAGVHGSTRPLDDEESDDSEESSDDDEEDGDDEAVLFEEEDDDEQSDEDNSGSGSWNGISSEADDTAASRRPSTAGFLIDTPAIERRVRFAGVSDSDSDSTTTDLSNDHNDFFPDIFVEQDSLDPRFRREIEYDPDDANGAPGTFWDIEGIYNHMTQQSAFDDEDESDSGTTPTTTPMASQQVSGVSTPVQSSPVEELDGYETDGDTTEDDEPEPTPSHARRRRSSGGDSDFSGHKIVRFRRGTPRTGRFHLDSSDKKPVAMVHPVSGKMLIFTPQRLRQLDLSPETFDLQFFGDNSSLASPIFSNSANLMMSAMFAPPLFGNETSAPPVGPIHAFFPFTSSGTAIDDSDDSDADAEEDEAEKNIDIDDFLISSDGDDEEADPSSDPDAPTTSDIDLTTTPTNLSRPNTAVSDASMTDAHPLLDHFEKTSRDVVGAFRKNQADHQLVYGGKISREALGFSNGFQEGTLRGIKPGSMDTALTPVAPLRRGKRSSFGAFDAQRAALAMSPPGTPSQKRKASEGPGNSLHKRHRSISDVEMIQT